MGIKLHYDGRSRNTERFLEKAKTKKFYDKIAKYAEDGVNALKSATPKDTGNTAASWDYTIDYTDDSVRISWTNSSENQGIPITILLQYGHGTRGGTYVEGTDYINPALDKVISDMVEHVWKQVIR